MEIEVTQTDIINFLGHMGKKENDELVFPCPICRMSGNDKHGNNLKYNLNKNVLYCFADADHSKQILSEIYKEKRKELMQQNEEVPKFVKYQNDYIMYQDICNAMLLGDTDIFEDYYKAGEVARIWASEELADDFREKIHSELPERARTYLEQKRGINTSTIDLTGIGIDFEGAKKWVIPIFNVNSQIVGFEYRGINFDNKRVWKEEGTPTCLVHVAGNINSEKAIINEGMLDSYILAQLCKNTAIFTCSNGVHSTLKCLSELHFSKYNEIQLILDNDTAGDEETRKILKAYPFIKDNRAFLKNAGVKDIGEWFIKFYML